jgi:circadian clock protein KaiB
MGRSPEEPGKSLDEHLAETASDDERYVLRLYVTGQTPRSLQAIQNIRQICETHLNGRYDLEVIDIYKQPSLAKGERVIAAPTLVKSLPAPIRRFVGDLSDTERVLFGLDLIPMPSSNER